MQETPEVATWLEQGMALHRRSSWTQALKYYDRIIEHSPRHVDAWHLAGQAFLGRNQTGDVQRGIEYLQHAIDLDNGHASFHNDLGNAFWRQRRIEDALGAFTRALELDPDFLQANFNFGNCCWALGRFREAHAAYVHCVSINPEWAKAHYMRANSDLALGRPGEALASYDETLARLPKFLDAYLGKATALLKCGYWHDGWQCLDHRLGRSAYRQLKDSGRRLWSGEIDPDAVLLVYGEQGIGDQIQFARFLDEARTRVGRVILAADTSLHRLFERLDGVDELIDKSLARESPTSIRHDYWVPLMSLARIFEVTPESVPHAESYLVPDEDLVTQWREYFDATSFNVGVVWSGHSSQKDNPFRSLSLATLERLLRMESTKWYSLQKGKAAVELEQCKGMPIVDLSDHLQDFADTAAVIDNLDLVISVDTAVAHLAGALGRPVWVPLWTGHCWRYLCHRNDTPWYASMRLFRQSAYGEWSPVLNEIQTQLALGIEAYHTMQIQRVTQ